MDRRGFLTLLGGGALGGAATSVFSRRPAPDRGGPRVEPVPDELDGPVPIASSGLQRIMWSIDTDSNGVALTFDDGPDPEFTPTILDLLERRGVKATFFVMGYNATQHPELLRAVHAAGHDIGSHSYSHLNLRKVTAADTRTEIDNGHRAIEDLLQSEVRLFRPPYGRFDEITVRHLAEKRRHMVVWSRTRGDLGWTDPERVSAHVVRGLRPGDVIGLHDGIGRGTFNRGTALSDRLRRRRHVEVQALPAILDGIEARGLRSATITELIARARPEDLGA